MMLKLLVIILITVGGAIVGLNAQRLTLSELFKIIFGMWLVAIAFSLLPYVADARHRRTPPPTTPPAPTAAQLVTNEFAHWNPNNKLAIKLAEWDMDSGSLFLKDGKYWTGPIDDKTPNYNSTTGTNSAVFRLVNKIRKGDTTS